MVLPLVELLAVTILSAPTTLVATEKEVPLSGAPRSKPLRRKGVCVVDMSSTRPSGVSAPTPLFPEATGNLLA